MIKFFRNIRKSLINQNYMGKYLKYAIGEILLVMIGIILALQVNNWNENRKSQQTKSVYINRLINDLKADTLSFSFYTKFVQTKVDDGKYIMKVINENEPILDNKKFILRLQNIGRVNVPQKANNTFLDLQGSGNLKLFNSDTIVQAVRSYYITSSDFWYAHYVARTTEGYLPIITDILPFEIAEEIVRSEFKVDPTLRTSLVYENYDLTISNDDLDLILEKINQKEDFNFHLKNATRAHLLQMRLYGENIKQATDLIRTLESLKE